MKPSHRQFWIAGSVSLSCLVASYPTSAQIVPDGTLPVNSTVIQQGTTTVIEGGTRAGGNLFHSFDAFSVPTGGAAYFNNALDINNILSRVTGRSISNIDGLIRANGTANLFLLNPNGIIFGPNARLNIGGSFLASTASSFQFADGSFFSATPSQTPPLLTISVPVGLQYGGNAAEIRVQGEGQDAGLIGISQNFDSASVLGVNPGNTLAIAGGNVIIDGGLLQAPGGRVELGGLAGAGTITLNPDLSLSFPEGVARANVLLTNRAGINVIGGANGGGSIAINAGSIGMMSESLLTSGLAFGLGEVNTRAGDITLNATNVTNIDRSRIENNVNSGTTGDSGNIEIATGSFTLTNQGALNTTNFERGFAGDIVIDAREQVSVTNQSSIVSNGEFGRVLIFSANDSIDINNSIISTESKDNNTIPGQFSTIDLLAPSGSIVLNQAILTTKNLGTGFAGDIRVEAGGQVTVANSDISSDGFFGRIFLNSTNSSIDISNTFVTTNTDDNRTNTNEFSRIDITAPGGSIVLNQNTISTSNQGAGFAGDITIEAGGQLLLTNNDISSDGFLGNIFLSSTNNSIEINNSLITTIGRGENFDLEQFSKIDILASSGSVLLNQVTISTTNFSSSLAGDITIDAGDRIAITDSTISSQGNFGQIFIGSSNIFEEPLSPRTVNIENSTLSTTNQGSTSPEDVAIDAGNIFISAIDSVVLGRGAGINSSTYRKGDAGSITIATHDLSMTNGAQLDSSSFGNGDAGSISIQAGDGSVFIAGNETTIFTTVEPKAKGDAGSISIDAGAILIAEGATLTSNNLSTGAAGNISLKALGQISLIDSSLTSTNRSDSLADFGDISVIATQGSVFLDRAKLNTTNTKSGFAGDITVNARNQIEITNQSKITSNGNFGLIFIGSSGIAEETLFPRTVSIDSSTLSTTNKGSISPENKVINAGNIFISAIDSVALGNNALINSSTYRKGDAGSITIATHDLSMTNGAQLDSSSFGNGDAGSISIEAGDGSVFIAGNATTIFTTVEPEADGDAGSISIDAGAILIAEGATLTSNNESSGLAGDITVQASGLVSVIDSSITSTSDSDRSGEVFGTIQVTAPEGSIFFIGSEVSTTNTGSGFAGDIILNARDLISIDQSTVSSDGNQGRILIGRSNISGETDSPSIVSVDSSTLSTSNGASISKLDQEIDAGEISIDAIDGVLLTKGSRINAFTKRLGDAGSITINVDNGLIYLADKSFIFGTVEKGGIGDGGKINLTARSLLLESGSEVQTLIRSSEPDPTGERIAGDINITASEDVFLVGSRVFSTVEPGGIGKAGSITISARSISVTDSGELNTDNRGSVAAGNITLTGTEQVRLVNSSITSKSNNNEDTDTAFGSIIITAPEGSVLLDNSTLSTTNTGSALAGDIVLNARDEVAITNGSKISSDGFDGRILIGESDASRDEYSQTYSPSIISIDASTLSTTNSVAAGNAPREAGDIFITAIARISLLNESRIDAFTERFGNAGNVTLLAENGDIILGGGSNIFTTVESGVEGTGGDINITGRSLSMADGARLTSTTFGKGDAGLVSVNVSGSVSLAGSRTTIFSTVASGAEGDGGFILIKAGSLSMTDGAALTSSTSGTGNAGLVSVTATDSISLVGQNTAIFSTVESGAVGDGGFILISGRSLSMKEGAQLQTLVRGSSDDLPAGQGKAGTVSVRADDFVSLTGNGTAIFSTIESGATGEAGGILIEANSLSMTDGAYLDSSTFGIGNAGAVIVNVDGSVSLTGSDTRIFSTVESGAVGDGGVISITAGSLSMTDGAQLQTLVRGSSDNLPAGQGKAGTVSVRADDFVSLAGSGTGIFSTLGLDAVGEAGGILIEANSLSMTDGAVLNASTFGIGNVGIVSVEADDFVSLAGSDTGIFTTIGSKAKGDALGILIKANSLSMTGGAVLDSSTFGIGDAGLVSIEATDSVTLAGTDTTIFSTVVSGAEGKGGNIVITGRSLSMKDGAALTSSTFGIGNAGLVSIDVDGPVSLAGSNTRIFSAVESGALGDGGFISITAGSLSMKEGAQLQTLVRGFSEDGLPAGNGNAGIVSVQVDDFVSLAGSGTSILSTIGSEAMGDAGGIVIAANSLSMTDGAYLDSSTFGIGDAGLVSIDVDGPVSLADSDIFSTVESGAEGDGGTISITGRSLSLTDGAQLQTLVRGAGKGNAGDIRIDTTEDVSLSGTDGSFTSSIFSTVEEGADGNAGNIDIEARSIFLRDRAQVTTSNRSSGSAGRVSLRARNRISLTESSVTATTQSGTGGDITINAPDLLVLRRNSNISTSAGQAGAPGDGGNIFITTDNLVALENSDITANAFEGKGGQIFITAGSIFGAQVRTQEELRALGFDLTQFDASQLPTSDITAISLQGNPNLQGNVSINTPDVDPSQGLVELPVQILDTENQIAQGCAAGKRNEFSVTGRGGLPPIPSEALGDNTTWTDFRTPAGNEQRGRGTEEQRGRGDNQESSSSPLVEAQGWAINDKGEVVLTAAVPTATLPRSVFLQAGCHQVSTTQN